jgi:hypothetical protein
MGMSYPLSATWPLLGGSAVDTAAYTKKVLTYSPPVYYPMDEASGANAINYGSLGSANGAYTGVTLGQPGPVAGQTCPLFDGVVDFNNFKTAAFDGAYGGTEFSISLWLKMYDVGVWTDGELRHAVAIVGGTGTNRILIMKSVANNQLDFQYLAGGVAKTVSFTSISTINWFHVGLTVDSGVDEMKAYLNGSQSGATVTGLGVWGGGNLNYTLIGARTTAGLQPANGWMAHFAYFTEAKNDAAMLDLATVA